jgi:hypothetical protein
VKRGHWRRWENIKDKFHTVIYLRLQPLQNPNCRIPCLRCLVNAWPTWCLSILGLRWIETPKEALHSEFSLRPAGWLFIMVGVRTEFNLSVLGNLCCLLWIVLWLEKGTVPIVLCASSILHNPCGSARELQLGCSANSHSCLLAICQEGLLEECTGCFLYWFTLFKHMNIYFGAGFEFRAS